MMHYKGYKLDKFQEDAIKAIEEKKSVVVSAPTGSGKTLIADYIIDKYLKKGARVIYTAPIKALSNQKYRDFSREYGKDMIGLLTGDVVINPAAPILIMTTEIYRNMVLTNESMIYEISYVVFDEIHYINDRERGYVWEESIIFSKPQARFLCLSATIPNADEFAEWISTIKSHDVVVIKHHKRSVPLHIKFYDSELGITTLEKIKEISDIPSYEYLRKKTSRRLPRVKPPSHTGLIKEISDKTPCFFFTFSRKKTEEMAVELSKLKIFKHNPTTATKFRQSLKKLPKDIGRLKSTQRLRQTIPYGIAFHHAGLISPIKVIIEELFAAGLINVLYTTETFAVGINMPAKTACFESVRKFDGLNFRFLNSKEFYQMAGRAGRRGIDKEGFVFVMIDRRDFDYALLKKITSEDKEPLKSQFKLSVNTVLNLIDQHTEGEIKEILVKNFHVYQMYGKEISNLKHHRFYSLFLSLKRKLERLGYIKDNKLTEKGKFSARIYADEILLGEIFATEFYKNLNEYQILLIIACISYEPRETIKFYKTYPDRFVTELYKKIFSVPYLNKSKKFNYLEALTSLIYPCYHGCTLFEILKNSSMAEGDVIRFFRQILDRIGQIKSATRDHRLEDYLNNCQRLIQECIKDFEII